MYRTSDRVKFTPHNDVNDVVDELFESLLSRYQDSLEISMKESDLSFDSVQLIHSKCHRVTFKRGGSYIDSPAWLETPQNGDNKCFQYATLLALNYQGTETHPERVSNRAPFINRKNLNKTKMHRN